MGQKQTQAEHLQRLFDHLVGGHEDPRDRQSRRCCSFKAALEWYGAPFDPDQVDEQRIIAVLDRIANTTRRSP
jgi:hypothetical protein